MRRMTMRERLIELLNDWGNKENDGVRAESMTDYLLANGVIVPPCKVGDVVYVEYHGQIKTGTVLEGHFYLQSADTLTVYLRGGTYKEYYIDDVYRTKEEAEQALRKEDEGK